MIRKYEEKGLSELLDTWYSVSQVAHLFLDEDFFEQERRNIVALHLSNAETWIYELDGVFIGNEVGAIFVNPEFYGQGIGQALMDKARSIRDVLELDIFKDNLVGRKFYEKYGFIQMNEHLPEETGFIQLG